MGVAAVAWVLHVAALALAPLSVVQVSLASGVVMLAVLGDRAFGCRVGRRQWAGACITAAGLVLLVVTLPGAGGSSEFAVPALLAFEASARAFQQGDAVPVIATTSTAANVTVIVGGLTVFGDALAGGVMLG